MVNDKTPTTSSGNGSGYALPDSGAEIDLALISSGPLDPNVMLKSRLWEIRKGHFLLQQTEPPVDKDWVGRDVQVSYLVSQSDNAWQRLGFTCPLRSVVELPHDKGQLLLVAVPIKVGPMSLRSLMRVTPRPEIKMSASLQLEGLSVPMQAVGDISLGGARLFHKGDLMLSEGQRLVLSLSWSGEVLLLPATLLRQDEGEGERSALVVRFVDMEPDERQELKNLLSRLWKRQRLAALTEAAKSMLAAHPDSFFAVPARA